ncbi:uncharacterized protein LOC141695326 [Apium graveolens]|uniref:uncharacterized protein LOC141695326 n=1 Tax=Apium graveolens TaxID=4045 RepID=UPI003D7A2677
MRLNAGNTESENKIIAEFSKWQLAVGDGKETNISPDSDSGEMLIKIPDQYIIHTSRDPIQKLFEICYAMTINKSQGQSLDTVGLYLPRAAFSHGHIYVAISRVTRPEGLHILIDSDDGRNTNITNNVVFEEVFYNLPSVDN